MTHMLISFALMLLTTGCTYSMIMTDTHGTATDVVDEQQSPTADVKPNIEVPLSPLK